MNLKTLNPGLRLVLFLTFGIGNVLLLVSRIYKEAFSDFSLGFLEGVSIVCILLGTSYLIWCALTKTNPLK